MFDPESKENRKYKEYFDKKSLLIVDPSKSLRTTIKKIFNDFGVAVNDIFTVNTAEEATDVLFNDNPHFVITQDKLDGVDAVNSLLPIHIANRPNRLYSGFYLISPDNSLASVIAVLEYEVDAYIAQPFTVNNILDTLLLSIDKKISPTPYVEKIEDTKEYIHKENFQKALDLSEESFRLSNKPGKSYFYKGLIKHKGFDDISEAIDAYTKGLEFLPDDYKLLNNLSTIFYDQKNYQDAYQLSKKLREKHPTNPKSFPMIVKLAIHTSNHEDIIEICNFFQQVEDLEEKMKNYIAASLTTCAIYFFNNDKKEDALMCLENSIDSCTKYEILESIVKLLISKREFARADNYLNSFNKRTHFKHAKNIQCLRMQILIDGGDVGEAFEIGNGMIKEGTDIAEVYLLMIKIGKKSGKSTSFIEEIRREAIRKFPQDKEKFIN